MMYWITRVVQLLVIEVKYDLFASEKLNILYFIKNILLNQQILYK